MQALVLVSFVKGAILVHVFEPQPDSPAIPNLRHLETCSKYLAVAI